jgi:hypothetical protein
LDKLRKQIKQTQIISMSLSVIAMVLCTSIGIHTITTGRVLAGTICVILGLANAICLGNNYSNFKKE